jgi:hypothetical protein
MDSYDILVIVLSIALAILLVVSIVCVVALTKLIKQLQVISNKAEEIVDDVEAVSGFFRKSAGPVAVTSLISNIVSKVADFNNKKGK